MKTMINSIILASCLALPLASCSDSDAAPEQKDWSTTTYFNSSDAAAQDTYYKPAVGYVGDPMPFFDPVAGDFKVLYLQDFRPNPEGTYHPIWGVSTKDAAHYTALGELVSCGTLKSQDAAIGTGSTIYDEASKLYYTFYTGNKYKPTGDESAQAVMVATSADFKTWTKDRTFLIKGQDFGYDKNDFRDPFVFKGDDGKFHMLVSTKKGGKGSLAEFVSDDLKNWTDNGVFMTMMWDRFYECPDLFKMGDYWYLVYSEIHHAVRRVQYFKGRTLDELKACTANDVARWPDAHEGFLDSRGLYAGKTASDGTNRYLWGWCPTRSGKDNTAVGASPAEPEWAGNLVCYKLIQHEDGTLTLGEVEAISNKYNKVCEVEVKDQNGMSVVERKDAEGNLIRDEKGEVIKDTILSGDNAYMLLSRLGNHNKISFTVTTSNEWDKFGISMVRGSDSKKYYTMVVNPENENNRKVNFEEQGVEGKGFIAGIDGYVFARPADNVYNITIYTDNSICVMYINDVCSYTNRIYGIQKNCWSINSYNGANVKVSNLKISQY